MSTSALVLLLLLLLPFPFLEPSSSYPFATPAAADQNYPMQRLPREELVRLAGYGEERLSSVLVTGTLLCQACLHPGSELSTSHIKGAKVAVACRTDEGISRRRRNYAIGTTDEFGDFMIDLPSQLHAVPKLQDSCVVRVLRLPRSSLCRHLSSVNPRRIELSSVGNGIRVYTGGNIKINLRSGSTNSQEYCFDDKN
ncbi:hypothetical protein AXF42_Ash015898 [Apostasia shenzhenica]|uniref:Pollen-specific protein C13 n=1 Tax=Apostasia shenzhenica TaxID=1088818 RepID=A0A2I0AWC7_9ASPA|nr:hypothetical protein AXF42_Ash015898 [Apostasia shenzhenica]